MAALVTTYGGKPIVAPALREVPLDSNPQAIAFADALIRGEFDLVILLTGVGTRALLDVVQGAGKRDAFVAALARTKVVPRGPKPLAVLRELSIAPWVRVPEPNTWREILTAIDTVAGGLPPSREASADHRDGPLERTVQPALAGRVAARPDRGEGGEASGKVLDGLNVAVQEYGVSNPDLVKELESRGARVTAVPVYRWALPENLEPLRAAISSLARGEVDVAIFTTTMQVVHLFQVAGTMQQEDAVRAGLRRMVVASIGPTTSEALRDQSVHLDLEASHPKMGLLVREAAERSPDLLATKRTAGRL